ncbi:MAG: hypothetical protein L3K26_13565 [Candidatus Hydrogenedentes bacterium]|nr:hypothetical protein [Candidatus Hydrogenedentota bacterium]
MNCHCNALMNAVFLGFMASFTAEAADGLPVRVGEFSQQMHRAYTQAEGLPAGEVSQLAVGPKGTVHARAKEKISVFDGNRWVPAGDNGAAEFFGELPWYPSLATLVGSRAAVRDVAAHDGEIAVAAEGGLYAGDGTQWKLVLPVQGTMRWAPTDVRAVAYDAQGRLWFAAPQGVGYRVAAGDWRLFTGKEGLPFSDFTCMATGPQGVWFGTSNGAIHYIDGRFEFRQGRRWLIDNQVNDLVVTNDGTAWFATPGGVSQIYTRPVTLAEKAEFYLAEIDRYHRYTPFGYVSWAYMDAPGAKETARARYTDNDGHYTGKYLAMTSLGYAVTGDPKLKADAHKAFRALAFLSEVTEGGTHPAPKGFIARTVRSTAESDPNLEYDLAYDLRRNKADSLWKIIQPRWPVDETGEWYWKCDSSSDELDGHYFGYGAYYDHVCKTEEEKEAVRTVVRRISDHLLAHHWTQTDHDGKPTRWGDFSPEKINQNGFWWVERGLKSLSILSYLSVTHHITGHQKYRDAFLELAWKNGYAMNGMTQPKAMLSPGAFGQGDDDMAFMNYYHLLRYETDPALQDMFNNAVFWHWQIEQYERNPLLNTIYAACNLGKYRTDQWGTTDLSPTQGWLDDVLFTLKRFPLDLVDWPLSNAHRIDIIPLRQFARGPGPGHIGTGYRVDGYTIPIDENHAIQSDQDPWVLEHKADGTRLNTGVSFLLPYYMARFHGFIAE